MYESSSRWCSVCAPDWLRVRSFATDDAKRVHFEGLLAQKRSCCAGWSEIGDAQAQAGNAGDQPVTGYHRDES